MFKPQAGFALTLAAVFALGCGGGEGGGEASSGSQAGQAQTSSVDPATAGNVSGRVTFTGTPPAAQPVDMSEEPVCAERYGGEGPMTQQVVTGPDGGLANVFVYVKEGLSGHTFPTPAAAELDQAGCRYEPHVLGLMVGQTMTIRNSDGILHNINASPSENRPFNVSQPVEMTTDREFRLREVMIPLRCDVHGWMSAYVGVLDHPYHAVTPMDGAFSLETLPPGDYVLEAWHERYGTATQNVTVTTGETAQVTFEFNEQMAGNPVPLAEPWILTHEGGTHHHRPAEPDRP